MSTIGYFKKFGENGYVGEITTLTMRVSSVKIVEMDSAEGVDAGKLPTHRVYVGRAEIGAGWSKKSEDGSEYLSLKLDDPSFNAPIYANLFADSDTDAGEGPTGFTLLWVRRTK